MARQAGQFKPGQSGNPKGRTPGVLNRRSHFPQLDASAPAIVDKLLELAKSGDRDALQLVVPRILPVLRAVDRPVQLPAESDPVAAAENVIRAVMAGEIPADTAERLMSTLRGAVAVKTGGVGGLPDEQRGQALRELRELMLGGRPSIEPPPGWRSADPRDDEPRDAAPGGDDR